jgi:hypothetical protein
MVKEIAAGIYSDLSSGKYRNNDNINELIMTIFLSANEQSFMLIISRF